MDSAVLPPPPVPLVPEPATVVARPREAAPRLRPITVGEYHRMGQTGVLGPDERVELLDGHLIAMSPVGGPHLTVVSRIARHLARHFDVVEPRLGLVSVQNPVRLHDRSEPEPDVALLRPEADNGRVPTAADALLVVEVADATLAYDRTVKRDCYARAGIPEVWIVAVAERYAEVARGPQPDGAYAEVRRIGLDGHLGVAAFPDAPPLPVASLFDGWAPPEEPETAPDEQIGR